MKNIKVFILYDGESEDGVGKGTFLKATEDVNEAYDHYRKVKKNPYSTGSVVYLTDIEMYRIFSEADELNIFGKKVK